MKSIEPLPLIEGILPSEPGKTVAEIRFDPVNDAFVREHCYRGNPLLPAAVALEAVAEGAALAGAGEETASLRDIEILHGLKFQDNRMLPARVEICGRELRLMSEFRSRDGRLIDSNRVLMRAKFDHQECEVPVYPAAIPDVWRPVDYPKEGLIIHGPAFQCLKELAFDGKNGFGRILAQSPAALGGNRQGTWRFPIAELDGCLVACGGYALKRLRVLALPKKLDCLRLFRWPLPDENCLVHVRHIGRESGVLNFDFALFGVDRTPILVGKGFGAGIVARGGEA